MRRVAFFWLGFAGVVVLAGWVGGLVPRVWHGVVCGTVGSFGALALSGWRLRRDGLGWGDVGLAWRRGSIARFLFGAVLGIALFAAIAGIGGMVGGWRWERSPRVDFAAVALSAVTFLALNTMEELGFRGYPLRRLEAHFGLWRAQLIVAVMFGLSHYVLGWPLPAALLGAGLGSLVFGMAAIASRGLALPIGIHAAGNLTDWMLGGKGPGGVWRVVVEGGGAPGQMAGWAAYCAVMLAALAGLWLWQRRSSPRASMARVQAGA